MSCCSPGESDHQVGAEYNIDKITAKCHSACCNFSIQVGEGAADLSLGSGKAVCGASQLPCGPTKTPAAALLRGARCFLSHSAPILQFMLHTETGKATKESSRDKYCGRRAKLWQPSKAPMEGHASARTPVSGDSRAVPGSRMTDSSLSRATSQAQQKATAVKKQFGSSWCAEPPQETAAKTKVRIQPTQPWQSPAHFLAKWAPKCCESPNSQFISESHSGEGERQRNICAGKIYWNPNSEQYFSGN